MTHLFPELLAQELIDVDNLFEASQYEALFSDEFLSMFHGKAARAMFYGAGGDAKKHFKNELNIARRELGGRKDVMIWYLRWLKIFWMDKLLDHFHNANYDQEEKERIRGIIEKEVRKFNKRSDARVTIKPNYLEYDGHFNPTTALQTLNHFFSLGINEIDRHRFTTEEPTEIFSTFANIETAANEARDSGRLIPDENERVFVRINDDWIWFDLERGFCKQEAEAMHHCGNVNPGDYETVLSLRERHVIGGEEYWEPHLTFILDLEDDKLHEMKGFGNQKPQSKYHPYIIRLLKDKRIKGIKGGGYLPENNFSLNDLDPDEREELLEEKPGLLSFFDAVMSGEEFYGELNPVADDYLKAEYGEDWDGYHLTTHVFEDVEELLSKFGAPGARTLYRYATGEDEVDYYDFEERVEDADLERALGPILYGELGSLLNKKHPGLVDNFGGEVIAALRSSERMFYDELVQDFVDVVAGVFAEDAKAALQTMLHRYFEPDEENHSVFYDHPDTGNSIYISYGGEEDDLINAKNIQFHAEARMVAEVIYDRHIDNVSDVQDEVIDYIEEKYFQEIIPEGREEKLVTPDDLNYEKWPEDFNFDEFQANSRLLFLGLRESLDADTRSLLKEVYAEKRMIAENKGYESMFSDKFLKWHSDILNFPNSKQTIIQQIKEAKNRYRKADRVVWYLKWWKIHKLNIMLKYAYQGTRLDLLEKEEFLNFVDDEIAKWNKKRNAKLIRHSKEIKTVDGEIMEINSLNRHLEHFLSLNLTKIQDIQWIYQSPDQLIDEFEEIEKEWKENIEEGLIPDRDEDVFIEVDNKFTWFDLHRGSCREEANAMGHCGNAGASESDTILSLREKFIVDGGVWWKPQATFILDKNTRLLGEMKGRGNDKPSEKFHRYIVPLLMDKRIKGIRGGGYLPENNFSIKDLPDELLKKIVDKKPELLSPMEYFDEKGVDSHFLSILAGEGWDVNEHQEIVLANYEDMGDFIEHRGTDTAKWVWKVLQANEDVYSELPDDNILWDALSKEQQKRLYEMMLKLYPNFEEDGFDAIEIIDYNEGELLEELKRLWAFAEESGTQSQMYEELQKALKEYPVSLHYTDLDSKVQEAVPNDVIQRSFKLIRDTSENSLSELEDIEEEFFFYELDINKLELEVEQPYYGFQDFDEKYFLDEVNTFLDAWEKKEFKEKMENKQ